MGFLTNIFQKIKSGFSSATVVADDKLVDSEYIEKLEEELIRSDLGVKLALDFISKISGEKNLRESQVKDYLKAFLLDAFKKKDIETLFKLEVKKLTVILVVGVNGVGKTTSIGKLAYKFKNAGHRVLIAAGDTFRAAAEEQLSIWAQRAGVDIVQLEAGARPSTVVYKAIEKAKAEDFDLLIIDTAGRLQSKQDLMDELSKLKQVISKNLEGISYKLEVMLVLDASTGSNALSQAEKFKEATDLDSIMLTKFDGSSRAGMVFALAYNYSLPVKFVGLGEKLEDIEEFNSDNFVSKYL